MMQVVSIEAAVGHALAHDITEIRPGEFKGAAFHRGHILQEDDLEHLRRLGKNHLYILNQETHEMHEDEAAEKIAHALCGVGVGWEGIPKEGKITLKATRDGLFTVAVPTLTKFNGMGDLMCATRHTHCVVKKGEKVAGTRAIPLMIDANRVHKAVRIAEAAKGGVLRVLPLKQAKVGVMITGNEVYHGRIEDRFEPIIRKKVTGLNGTIHGVCFLPDDDQRIADAALNFVKEGVDVLITTGGMSVDPDDRTRFGLKKAGARNMLYGSAVLPGAMFMIATLKGIPVLGIPACGLFAQATVFDLVYPRILAGERITRKNLAKLGHGGLCLQCEPCRYPECSFGKSF
jgi:hypothetical protein